MRPHDLVIKGRLVLPEGIKPGWLTVDAGLISAIGKGEAPGAKSVHDFGDNYVLAGFVDGQTHATSYRGLPGMAETTLSALAGGITTIVDMPYDNPDPLNNLERLEAKIAAVNSVSHCDVALYATIAPGQSPAVLSPLAKAGVCAFKISSFESHPVRFPRLPHGEIIEILEASADTGLPVGLHNEDQEIVRTNIARLRSEGRVTPEWHEPSRPVSAELVSTVSFLEMGAATGAHVHLVHISTPRGYELVERYKAEGVHATAELCVHYLHFDADRDIGRLGALMKVNPPIRGSVLDGLWRTFEEGKIQFVSSDHSSWPVNNKQTPAIFDAGAGIPGLETLAASFFTDLKARVEEPVVALTDYLSGRPARFFGLDDRKGRLALGLDADIAILEEGSFLFDASRTRDGLNWSPYDGETFAARISATYLRGSKVWNGRTVLSSARGRFLPRGRKVR